MFHEFIHEFGCTKVPDAASVQACARKESLAVQWRRTLANPSQLLHPSRRLEEAHSLKGICAEDRDRRLQARAHDGPVHAPAPLGGGRPQCSASALPVTRTPPGGGDARRHYHAQRRGLLFFGPCQLETAPAGGAVSPATRRA